MAEQEERLVLRTVPHAKEAEESVIGAMIRDQDDRLGDSGTGGFL